jgi:surface polysaccharide O-acyltransferase-like enzyme
MNRTVRNLTLAGLIIQTLSLIGMLIVTIVSFQPVVVEFIQAELGNEAMWWGVIRTLLLIFLSLSFIFLTLNAYLFIPIIQGKSVPHLSGKFLYLAIYGAFNLSFNQLMGLIYLIAGIMGYNQIEKEENPIRDGI